MHAEGHVGHWHVRMSHDLHHANIELRILRVEGDEVVAIENAKASTTKVELGSIINYDPWMVFPSHEVKDFMRAMVDAAWDMGIKPSKVDELSAGENQALKGEVEFLRGLVTSVVVSKVSFDPTLKGALEEVPYG